MTYKTTYHSARERTDRSMKILTTTGIGNILMKELEVQPDNMIAYRCLTDTGVILILDQKEETVVTMWFATMEQANSFYAHCGKKMPVGIRNQVKSNIKKGYVTYKKKS